MQGDPVVDRLMQPVEKALQRHGIKGEARTDIYNRAYEAVMNSMVVMDTMREQLSKANESAERMEMAIRAVLREPYGCRFCDCGKLRNPEAGHDEDCPYVLLRNAVWGGGEG